jgi:hypothetical protein
MFDFKITLLNILLESDETNVNELIGTTSYANIFKTVPHFDKQSEKRYFKNGITKEQFRDKMNRTIKVLKKLGYLNNPQKEQSYFVWFTNSLYSFVIEIDPSTSIFKWSNPKNFNFNQDLPSIIFTTAIPMKEEKPWHQLNDIEVLINESKMLNGLKVIKIED